MAQKIRQPYNRIHGWINFQHIHLIDINSLLQMFLHSSFQNYGQYWWLGCDKDAYDSYHKVTTLTEKVMTEFLPDNYLERNYDQLLICSPKLPLMFRTISQKFYLIFKHKKCFHLLVNFLFNLLSNLLSTDAVKPLSWSVSWSITTIGEDPGTGIGSDEVPEGKYYSKSATIDNCWLSV